MPRILVAATPSSFILLRRLLDQYATLVPVFSFAEALQSLPTGINLVICTAHFDESHVFELLRVVKINYPGIPLLCARISDIPVRGVAIEAIALAAGRQNFRFFDWQAIARVHGEEVADAELRSQVLLLAGF